MLTRAQKIEIVKNLRKLLWNSLLSVFCNFSGISFEKQKKLKEAFKEKGIEVKVVKTSLLKKALELEGIPSNELQGQILGAFGKDEVQAAKIFYQFAKENLNQKNEKLNFVLGIALEDGKLKKLLPEDLKFLATLPTVQESKAKLYFALKSLLSRFLFDLQNLQKRLLFILASKK
jgi:large subunit ribosomal protein L10